MPSRTGSAPLRAARPAVAFAGACLLWAAVTGCAARTGVASAAPLPPAATVRPGSEHGLVLTRSAGDYLVLLDLAGARQVWTAEQLRTTTPAEGDAVVRGTVPVVDGPDARHVDVHVYDLRTGEPVRNVTPRLTLVDHVAGRTTDLEAALLRDVEVGERDDHFGTNVDLPAGHRFTLRVDLGSAATEFSGVLP